MSQRQISTPWLTPLYREQNDHLRLIFFPHAGGGASTFYPWSRVLPAGISSYAVQLPGRETRIRDTLHWQMQSVVQALTNALPPFLDQPFIFWGHSMGALLAYEVAQKLQQVLKTPRRLIVSGCNAPHIPYLDPQIHQLPEAEFIAALQELNGTPSAVLQNAELRDLILPALRADFQIVETYTYQESQPLNCPITVLDGLEDDKTNEADLQEWQKHTSQLLEMFTFPGDHFFLYDRQPALVETVGNLLNHQLQHIQR